MKKNKIILLALAFFSGLSIMAMEITASRLMAPYFGTTIFVWTNIIGVVLVALSLGYYYGGKIADRIPSIELLLRLFFAAGCLFLVIPLFIKPLSQAVDLETMGIHSASVIIFISSLIIATCLFALPVFLLGMVSPFIIKLYLLEDNEHVGESAGRVSAVSTVGSIIGTFLPTLFFIPFLGTRATINFFALALIVIGLFGFKKNNKLTLLLLTIFPAVIYFSGGQINNYPNTIFEDESVYQYISIRQDPAGVRYLSVNEGSGIQSVYDSQQILTGFYYDYFNILPYLIDPVGPKKVLIIGLCGGTIANQLSHFFPEEMEIDGVEIDPKIIQAAKDYFAIESTNTNIYNSDGRMFLQNNAKKYDLIVVDAYAQESYIPWTLTTKEFWGQVKNSLGAKGIIAINVNSIDPDAPLLRSISNTIASIFMDTYITPVSDGRINYVLFAANNPLDISGLEEKVKNKELKELALVYKNSTNKVQFDENEMVLTDDRAPVEFMTDKMTLDYLRN